MRLLRITGAFALCAGLAVSPVHADPPATLHGWLTLVWVDARDATPQPEPIEYWLTEPSGQRARLDVPLGLERSLQRLDRRFVRVRGEPRGKRFRVAEAQAAPATGDAAAGAEPIEPYTPSLGRQPWINVLCKYADRPEEPRTPDYFAAMFSSTRPGLDYYWKELSNSQLSVSGTRWTSWHTLPRTEAEYGGRTQDILEDCTAAADDEVDYNAYAGINLIINGSIGCCSYGGAGVITRDGVTRVLGVTWMADWGWTNHTVFGHEMGHAMGIHHSRGNQQTYRNLWDVMSDLWYRCDLNRDPVLGCLGQHMIAHAKNRLGWIPEAARYVAAEGSRQTLRLDRLERPRPGLYQMAIIPIRDDPYRFYTVEVRRKYGYDVRMPGASVVIHQVDERFAEAANVVDGDGNGDPYDAGTRWLVGETFEDRRTGVSVSVDGTDGDAGFMVTIERKAGALFGDGFESGDLSRWSGGKLDGGDVAVTSAAAMAGAWGLQVVIDDNNQAHLTDHTPEAERSYYARFRFNPNSIRMNENDIFTIFGAYADTVLTAVIEMRRLVGWNQLRVVTREDDGSRRASAWSFIGNYTHDIELEWGAADPGQANGWLTLFANGTHFASYWDLDNDTVRVERTLLGAVTGVDSGTRGTLYFDDIETRRW